MNIDDFGSQLVAFLSGRKLFKIARVSVELDGESVELGDTLVLFRNDGTCVQLLLEQEGPRVREMLSRHDYEIIGEYRDRTADSLRSTALENVPLEVSTVHVAYETGATTGENHVIGVFLLDAEGRSRASFTCHVDDIKYGSGALLWKYLDAVIGQAGLISIKRFIVPGVLCETSKDDNPSASDV